jgi:gamma-glutamyltranspeptidase/glutathione hydrolase|tara:strand:- start:3788 stop:5488 length:1701 start_codon:yes stop_codon:yes gene_type:complete
MINKFLVLTASIALLLFNGNLISQTTLDYKDRVHPEISEKFMVVSQNYHATEVGYKILEKGGNAVDAAVAMGFALAVTLPRAGNLGGGGFMLLFDAKTKNLSTLDYRSAAPKLAKSSMYLTENGVVRYGHLVNAVPGTVAGLIKAHSTHGKLSLKQVMRPAIELAHKGIFVSNDLNFILNWGKESLLQNKASKNKFYRNEEPLEINSLFRQPRLAKTLTLISQKGHDVFYKGEIADWIVEDSLSSGGLIRKGDLAAYEAKERIAIEIDYRGNRVVSMPPTASGGLVLLQTLNILENFDIQSLGHNSASSIHHLSESMIRAFADRAKHHGDPDYYDVPVENLLNKDYSRKGAQSIKENLKTPDDLIFAGDFKKADESPDTTHLSVVDEEGNAVSLTYTLGSSFGSGVTVAKGGFLLNNQMRNFSHYYGDDTAEYGKSEANKLEPGKRMISTQAPTLVFNSSGDLSMILGSPGGGRIPNILTQVISNVIDHNLGFAEAVMAPRINQRVASNLEVETGISPDTLKLLKSFGHTTRPTDTMGSVQAIFIKDNKLYGVADTRRPDAMARGK